MQESDSELEIFAKAVELADAERDAYLDSACGDNEALRSRIEILLAVDEQAEQSDFLAPAAMNLKETVQHRLHVPSLIGRNVGAFRIAEKIGSGGMGEVYRATRKQDYDHDVAIKVVRQVLESEELARRFQAEAQFTAKLGKHANIAGLIDAGMTEDGLLYLVMDYVDGQRIDDYCDANRFTIEQRLRLFLQVCDAVQFAHQNAIIHRDLKPSNILVSQGGNAKLIDFGIAKLMEPNMGSGDESTRTIYRILTPEYASPEQARGEPPTTASDVYSLGVVLYGLLAGTAPYRVAATNSRQVAQAIEDIQAPMPSAAVSASPDRNDIASNRATIPGRLERQLAGDLGNVLMMALRKEPERRYPTVEQFADDLRKYLSGHPVRARKDTIRYRTQKFLRRNRFAAAMAASLLLTLIGGIVGTSTQWIRAQQEWRRAEENAQNARTEAIRATNLAQQEAKARVQAETAQRAAAESAREATLQAETAQEVSDFLVRLFHGADRFGFLDYQFGPSEGEEANPTATQLLARGRTRLDSELKNQPVVRAALKTRIAQVYMSLGSFVDAETLLQAALETQRVHRDAVAVEDIVETLSTLGVIRYAYGYYEAAKEYLGEAIALCDQSYGASDSRGANAKLLYAMVEMEGVSHGAGKWEEAKKRFREVVKIRESQPDAAPYDLAHAYIGEAVVERTNGDLTKSTLALGKAAVQLGDAPGGTDYIRTWMLATRAIMNWQNGNHQAANQQTELLLRRVQAMLGEKHPAVSILRIDFAWRMIKAKQYEKAEAYLRKGIELSRASYGEQPRTAYAIYKLSLLLARDANRVPEAITLLREATDIYTRTLGADHPRTRGAKQTLIAQSKRSERTGGVGKTEVWS